MQEILQLYRSLQCSTHFHRDSVMRFLGLSIKKLTGQDPYTRHRALFLYSPTVEMSGAYTCKVSTLNNEVKTIYLFCCPREENIFLGVL
jgi:hypothetical protein